MKASPNGSASSGGAGVASLGQTLGVRVLAVTGLKGGVGKTATAVNLAALAGRSGHRTLLWDLDPQGAATHCFDLRPKLKGGAERLFGGDRDLQAAVKGTADPWVDVVPADVSLRNADLMVSASRKPGRVLRRLLAGASRRYDVAVLDCPPGLGAVAEAVVVTADLLLVPVLPAPLGVRAFEGYATFVAQETGSDDLVAPFVSMIDRRKPLHRRMEAEIRTDRRFLATIVPLSSAVERLGHEQVPTVVSTPRSLAADGYRRLWAEVAERISL